MSAAKSPAAGSSVPTLAWIGLLAVLTLGLYWPNRDHDFVNYDDRLYVTENVQVQRGLDSLGWAFRPDSLVAANWHPVTMLSHLLDVELHGLDPTGHHFSSHLWHALNVALVFLVLRRLGANDIAAAIVAALFAVHPTNVQSVAWIAERKNVLSTTFWLAAIWIYCHPGRRSPRRIVAVTICTLLGLMAKPMLVTLPFTLLLLDRGPLNRREEGRQLWLEKLPLFAAVGIFIVVTLRAQSEGDAVGNLPLSTRLLHAPGSYAGYLEDLFWPVDRTIFQPHPGLDVSAGAALVGILSTAAITALLWWRRQSNALVGWLWFLGTLVPVLGLVQVGDQARADRYLYVPALGLFAAAVALAARLGPRPRPVLYTVALGLVGALALGTRAELAPWQNSELLFRHALAQEEANYLAHNNLATAILEAGDPDTALRHYRRSTELNGTWAVSRMNLGIAYLQMRQGAPAQEQLALAVQMRPNWAEAHSNLGAAYMLQRQFDLAIRHLEQAVRLNPQLSQARNNLQAARQYQAGQAP